MINESMVRYKSPSLLISSLFLIHMPLSSEKSLYDLIHFLRSRLLTMIQIYRFLASHKLKMIYSKFTKTWIETCNSCNIALIDQEKLLKNIIINGTCNF